MLNSLWWQKNHAYLQQKHCNNGFCVLFTRQYLKKEKEAKHFYFPDFSYPIRI